MKVEEEEQKLPKVKQPAKERFKARIFDFDSIKEGMFDQESASHSSMRENSLVFVDPEPIKN